jgi:transcriptional regulator with XRE-family HTH domain
MPGMKVTPRRSYFDALCDGKEQASIAKKLGIAVGTLRTLRRGEMVTRGLIEYIADKRQCPVLDLIEPQLETKIPDQPDYFEALRHGWFIDHDRRRSGAPMWFTESLELTRVPNKKKHRTHLCFTGRLVNQLHQAFRITAERRNDNHFSLTALSESDDTAFDACFTIRMGDVLCGTWSGYPNHLGSNVAIYRYFVSAAPLTLEDLLRLSQEAKIECCFQADAFAEPGAAADRGRM